MKTQLPFSSISYNTVPWLELQLNTLLKDKKIVFWAYICHKGEDDEAGKKDHIHVYIEPDMRFRTTELTDMCIEPVTTNPLPLKMMPCRHSDFDNWYKYVRHDPAYLRYKGLGERKYEYSDNAFVTSDEDYLLCKIREIDLMHVSWYSRMMECIENNISFNEFFAQGSIPVQQVRNYEIAWQHLQHFYTLKQSQKKQIAKAKNNKIVVDNM